MTYKELSLCFRVQQEIQDDIKNWDCRMAQIRKEKLHAYDLRRKASSPSAPNMSGVPSGHNQDGTSAIERLVGEACDIEALLHKEEAHCKKIAIGIKDKELLCLSEQLKIWHYISKIPDSRLRLIFAMRFVDGMPWFKIAMELGEPNTGESVKMLCYRFLNKGAI